MSSPVNILGESPQHAVESEGAEFSQYKVGNGQGISSETADDERLDSLALSSHCASCPGSFRTMQ